jgi:hypothetical protein
VRHFQLSRGDSRAALRHDAEPRDRPPDQPGVHGQWLLEPGDNTWVTLKLDAQLRVPAYIPADGIADEIARAFIAAASRALSTSPRHVAGRPV